MLSILLIVLPIFALILTGWVARRADVLGPAATGELNRFVVYLALPALLFDIVANAHWRAFWQPGFLIAEGGGAVVVLAATVALAVRRRGALSDGAVDGLNAAYANSAFIGFPLVLAVAGPAALPLVTLATLVTVGIVLAGSILLIEIDLHRAASRRATARKVAGALARNPLLIAPVAGALVPLFGWSLPAPVGTFLKLLGAAASPCALVALGLFLAQHPLRLRAVRGQVMTLVALKLIGQPLLTWLIAVLLLDLPSALTRIAVLLAALPTGTGPFLLAERYRRDARTTSNVVLLSTALSILTIPAYLASGW